MRKHVNEVHDDLKFEANGIGKLAPGRNWRPGDEDDQCEWERVMIVSEKVRDKVIARINPEMAQSYRELLGVVQRLYDLTGQMDLKEILDRAKSVAPS